MLSEEFKSDQEIELKRIDWDKMSTSSKLIPNIYVSESHRSFNVDALKEQALKLKKAAEIRGMTHGVKTIFNP